MINVLDYGYVRLHNSMGNDLEVVRAARQSFDAAWRAGENEGSDARLIRYLMKNHHSTPFEVVEFQFDVKAPIFVLRQWQRHRTFTYVTINEVSARYRELAADFYTPDTKMVGAQSTTNKQGRTLLTDVPLEQRQAEVACYRERCNAAVREYNFLLDQGWPRELARCVLPLSTYTSLFIKVDLWNLLHFLDLRTHEHAQYEIRAYANALVQLIEPVVPVTIAAWRENQ